jgi:uncharacterized protein (TIGR02996 family)
MLSADIEDLTDGLKLPRLLVAWREASAAELAELIDAVSERVATGRSPLEGKKLEDLHAAWLQRERAQDPADLPLLLKALRRQRSTNAIVEMKALACWPRDPRITTFMCRLFEDPPYWSSAAFSELLALAARSGDPRLGPALSSPDLMRGFLGGFERAVRDTIAARAAEIVESLPASVTLDAANLELVRRLSTTTSHGQRHVLDQLLAQIYADPQDTSLKMVYADALLEAGEARGELIVLQAGKKKGAKKRGAELIAAGWKQWLGPLAGLVDRADDVTFELGFPVALRLSDTDAERERRATGSPQWATVHTVVLWDHLPLEMLTHPVASSLRVVRGMTAEGIAELKRHGKSVPWTWT